MDKYYIWLKSGMAPNDGAAEGLKLSDLHCAQSLIEQKRRALKEYYTACNAEFGKKYDITPIYSSKYSHCIVAELTHKRLCRIQQADEVSRVSRYIEKQLIPLETDIVSRQVRFDSINGSHSPSFENGGYLGNGVKIGVISAQNLTYIANDAQLRAPQSEGRLVDLGADSPTEPSVHSSVVASIIVGGSVYSDGIEYRGIAPKSIVCFAPSFGVMQVYEAIEKCLDYGAVIINYSAGEAFPDGEYSDFDRQIDTLIYNVGFCFTVAAGNSGFVASPGTCFNGITVGNARTKNSAYSPLTPPYTMFYLSDDDCSAYKQSAYIANKPDISAPGSYIHYIDSRRNVRFNLYGTSFAAPYAAGVAAQIAEKYPNARLLPLIIKGVLLCGADGDGISSDDNPTVTENNLLRQKSGAGFLNSVGALENMSIQSGVMLIDDAETHGGHADVMLNVGQRFRAVLCFFKAVGKTEADFYKNNIKLELFAPDGSRIISDDSPRENVKLVEYTAVESGRYTLVHSLNDFDAEGGNVPYSLVWRIIG